MRALMHCESMLLRQRLGSAAGAAVAFVGPAGLETLDCPARVSVRLQLCGAGRLQGDVISCADAWPFADHELDFVILRHALESSVDPRALLHEAVRVLAPGGQLLITGFHPCSLWHLHMLRQQRRSGGAYRAWMPWRMEAQLRGLQLRVKHHVRYGSAHPASRDPAAEGGPFAACYLLQACKHSTSITPIRLGRSRAAPAVIGASLAGTARRQRAG